MNDSRSSEVDADLDSWVVDFLEAEERGTPLDETTCLNVRPELREPVSKFVKFHRQLHELTGPLRQLARQSREGGTSNSPASLPNSVAKRSDELPRRLGPFELLERIGQGGMGVVYKAHQLSLQRVVAVKTTRADVSLGEDELQRFRNEAELVARLDHPGIVPVYEVGVCERQLFFSMRLLEGGDLGRRLDQFRDDPRAAATLLVTVARAVHYAHQRGVLHRDLKPSNILLDGQGQPLVADFGLARRFAIGDAGVRSLGLRPEPVGTESQPTKESLTKSGLLIGTPGYMAPEQVARSSRILTTATDVYGLGAVLFALLTGKPPFRGLDTFDTLLLVGAGDPTPPRRFNAGVDRDLECICLKCLAREPERRYASAADVADDLERWLGGIPIVARPAGFHERFWRHCRRHPAVASLSFVVATLLIALLCGLAVSVVLLRGEKAETRKQQIAAEDQAAKALDRETEARRLLYVSDIHQAARAHESSDLPHMNELLDRHVPKSGQTDFRGFEWRYLRHLARSRDVVDSYGQLHQGQVFCVTHSPDGRRLATSSEDRSVVVWDAVSRQRLFELKGFADDANGILFTPDGQTLIASGEDGSIWTCDAETGANPNKRYQTPGHDPVRHLDINADGNLLVANCSASVMRRFEFPSMKELPEQIITDAHQSTPGPVRFSLDGATLITAGRNGSVLIWEAATMKLRHRFQNWSEVRSLAVARDRPWAAACGDDRIVRVFDFQTGKMIHELTGLSFPALSVSISADDAWIAAADRLGNIRVWDFATGDLIDVLPGTKRQIWCLMFAPQGRTILAGDDTGQVWKWTPGTPRVRQTIAEEHDEIRQVLWLPQTQELAWLHHPSAQISVADAAVADAASVGTLARRASEGSNITGKLEPSLTRRAGFETDAGSVRHGVEVRKESVSDGANQTIVFAGDGQRWIVGCLDGAMNLWQRGESQPRWKVQAHPTCVNAVAITLDGKTVFSCADGDQVRVWDTLTGEPRGTLTIDDQPCVTFALSSDGTTAAVASYQKLALVNVKSGQVQRQFPRTGVPLAFSSDGSLLAVANKHSIEIWPTQSESPPRILLGHTQAIKSLAFSPDNRTLASASHDGTVRLWHVLLGQELLSLRGAEKNHSVTFSPDGRRLFACGENQPGKGVLYAWDAPRMEQLPPDFDEPERASVRFGHKHE